MSQTLERKTDAHPEGGLKIVQAIEHLSLPVKHLQKKLMIDKRILF